MRKFWIFILVLCMTLLSSQTFWYFENKVYCNFEKGNVTIFLKNEGWMSKCKSYLDTIYQLASKKYNEISVIRSYIEQWEDAYYWKTILEEKNAEFLQLVSYRTQVKMAVDKFEATLFDKYYSMLEWAMNTYYLDLETQYYILINQENRERAANYWVIIAELEQQMWNVSHILNAKTLDEIMEVVPTYLYLKNKLAWR